MSESKFIRLSGWALMLGAVAFSPFIVIVMLENTSLSLPEFQSALLENAIVIGFFWSPVLVALGMLGLRARYGNEIGASGKGVLLLGALAGLLVIVGNIGQAYEPDPFWGVFIIGTTLIFICMLIFGIQALIQKPLPRMNWLPLFAGMWFPMMSLPGIFGIHFPAIGLTPNLVFSLFSTAGIIITTVALILLGYTLQAYIMDGPEFV